MSSLWEQIFDDDPEFGEVLHVALGNSENDQAVAARVRACAAGGFVATDTSTGQGPQGKKEKMEEFSWEKHERRLSQRQFKKRYRLTGCEKRCAVQACRFLLWAKSGTLRLQRFGLCDFQGLDSATL